jgi:2-polyprenyl-3-methyl-5-hydroxy-6-metoxy-1,4-benzoquinol methylase
LRWVLVRVLQLNLPFCGMSDKFSKRSFEQELMDKPGINMKILHQNLKELDKLNDLTFSSRLFIKALKKVLTNEKKVLQIVDLGCGSGHILKNIAKWGRRNGYFFELIGVDKNPRIIEYMNQHCKDYPEIIGIVDNVTDFFTNNRKPDIVISSLFFHHLSNDELTLLFHQMKSKVKTAIFILDLQRSKVAYWVSWIITRLLNGTKLSKNDGPLSVLRAFSESEWVAMLKKAGISNFTIFKKSFFRYLITCDLRKEAPNRT